MPEPRQQPTMVRYGVLAFSVSMAVLLYLDRMAISVAMPAIAEDLDLRIEQVADSVGAFFWCYALFQIPAGWLGDHWGGRRALTLYVVAWSLAIAGMGFASGLASLIVMRSLLGIGQAGAYATTASFLRRWIPFSSRGVANSAVSLGGRAGGALAPALTSLCMALTLAVGINVARWRPVFIVYGVVGLVWAWFFWRWFRDNPRDHAGANAAEVALITGPADDTEPTQKEREGDGSHATARPTHWAWSLLTHRGLYLLGAISFSINVGWIFVGTLLPTYLIKIHGQTEIQAGFATSLVAFAGMAGCLAGGFATDFLVRRLGLAWGRRTPAMMAYGGAAVCYAICYLLDDPRAIIALLVVASFMGDFALGALWSTFQDIGGVYAGTVLGAANMCGNFGAASASSFVPRLAIQYGWSATFALSAATYAVATLGWLFVDPRVRIAATDKHAPSGN